MSVNLALTVILILTIVAQFLALTLAGAADSKAMATALKGKDATQVGGIGCLILLMGLVIGAGWVYVGYELHRPLIIAITVVNLVMTVVWQVIKAALK